MTDQLDVVVIGGGVVGLAIARRFALDGRDVTVLEREPAIGAHTSSRNSEVIHAGIYYTPGSWKARLCVAGRSMLYDYCAEQDVPHRRVGKLIVATSEAEIDTLAAYKQVAETNGVSDLIWLTADEARGMEPEVRCVRALLSPSTGIIDSHTLMARLRRDLERAGGRIALNASVIGGRVDQAGVTLEVGGSEATVVRCQTVINAAGPWAPRLARTLRGLPAGSVPREAFAKGHYFVLRGRSPFSRLVYPVAVRGGLGVHVTLDLAGRARFGPDVAWIDDVDYTFDEGRAASFYDAIRRYFPALTDGSLDPGYTGVRPKILPADGSAPDFLIQGGRDHGVPGLVNLYGIESPGLTAALALAEQVRQLATAGVDAIF